MVPARLMSLLGPPFSALLECVLSHRHEGPPGEISHLLKRIVALGPDLIQPDPSTSNTSSVRN
jgi:hypothetical protein